MRFPGLTCLYTELAKSYFSVDTFMYTRPLGLNMAKLYWRVKKNGKWTWKPAVDVGQDEDGFICVLEYEEESS